MSCIIANIKPEKKNIFSGFFIAYCSFSLFLLRNSTKAQYRLPIPIIIIPLISRTRFPAAPPPIIIPKAAVSMMADITASIVFSLCLFMLLQLKSANLAMAIGCATFFLVIILMISLSGKKGACRCKFCGYFITFGFQLCN